MTYLRTHYGLQSIPEFRDFGLCRKASKERAPVQLSLLAKGKLQIFLDSHRPQSLKIQLEESSAAR